MSNDSGHDAETVRLIVVIGTVLIHIETVWSFLILMISADVLLPDCCPPGNRVYFLQFSVFCTILCTLQLLNNLQKSFCTIHPSKDSIYTCTCSWCPFKALPIVLHVLQIRHWDMYTQNCSELDHTSHQPLVVSLLHFDYLQECPKRGLIGQFKLGQN